MVGMEDWNGRWYKWRNGTEGWYGGMVWRAGRNGMEGMVGMEGGRYGEVVWAGENYKCVM